jgi:hypothetical protein
VYTVKSKSGSWIRRKILRKTSSSHVLNKSDRQIKHKRSISDFSLRLRKRDALKDRDLQELVRLCGLSLFYLPSEYAVGSLALPTCFRATAQYLVQHGKDLTLLTVGFRLIAAAESTRGIFRIPGAHSTVNALYEHFAAVDENGDAIAGTVRCPRLPDHIPCDVYDVASVFKRFLAGLPAGILGSADLFGAFIAIQYQLNSDPEWTRTKQSKVRARLIALAIATIRSQYRRELVCAVLGLLSWIGRNAETAPRENDRGRPLPTSGYMGYEALGIVFGPLLLGDLLSTYHMPAIDLRRGLLILPVSPPKSRKERHRRRKVSDEPVQLSPMEKVKVANGITSMLITHWRDVVRHMKSLDMLKTTKDRDRDAVFVKGRRPHLRSTTSEVFTVRKPRDWDQDLSRPPDPESPTPIPRDLFTRHLSRSSEHIGTHGEPLKEHGNTTTQEDAGLAYHRLRPRLRVVSSQRLSGARSLSILSPTVEESSAEDELNVPISEPTISATRIGPRENSRPSCEPDLDSHGSKGAKVDSGLRGLSGPRKRCVSGEAEPCVLQNSSVSMLENRDFSATDGPVPTLHSHDGNISRKDLVSSAITSSDELPLIRDSLVLPDKPVIVDVSQEPNADVYSPAVASGRESPHVVEPAALTLKSFDAGETYEANAELSRNEHHAANADVRFPAKSLSKEPGKQSPACMTIDFSDRPEDFLLHEPTSSAAPHHSCKKDKTQVPVGIVANRLRGIAATDPGIQPAARLQTPLLFRIPVSHAQHKLGESSSATGNVHSRMTGPRDPLDRVSKEEDEASLEGLACILGSIDDSQHEESPVQRRETSKDETVYICREPERQGHTSKLPRTVDFDTFPACRIEPHADDLLSKVKEQSKLSSEHPKSIVHLDITVQALSPLDVQKKTSAVITQESMSQTSTICTSSSNDTIILSPKRTSSDELAPVKAPSYMRTTVSIIARQGSVKERIAKFNNVEQTSSQASSPIKTPRARGIARSSHLGSRESVVSQYTTNPSPARSARSNRSSKSEISTRTTKALLHGSSRREERSIQGQDSPTQNIPAPLRLEREKPIPTTPCRDPIKSTTCASVPIRTNHPEKVSVLNLKSRFDRGFDGNVSFSLSDNQRRSSPANLGTVLPFPSQPPVASFLGANKRPPDMPTNSGLGSEIDSVPMVDAIPALGRKTSHAALYEQIGRLQRLVSSKTEDTVQLKRLIETKGLLGEDIGILSEEVRVLRRECAMWRTRALGAERRLEVLGKVGGMLSLDGITEDFAPWDLRAPDEALWDIGDAFVGVSENSCVDPEVNRAGVDGVGEQPVIVDSNACVAKALESSGSSDAGDGSPIRRVRSPYLAQVQVPFLDAGPERARTEPEAKPEVEVEVSVKGEGKEISKESIAEPIKAVEDTDAKIARETKKGDGFPRRQKTHTRELSEDCIEESAGILLKLWGQPGLEDGASSTAL